MNEKNEQQAQPIPQEMQNLALCLKKFREEHGFSIREAAKQAYISPSYLSKIETGDTFTTIGIKTLVGLAKAYNTPLAAILQEAGFIDSHEHKLPELSQYLRLKYHLSQKAINDMEMAKEIVDRKYKEDTK